MSGSVTPYINLLTSEHNQKPNFVASVTASVQPFADALAVLSTFPALFDIDTAVGSQLDVVGEWIGASRELAIPLTGVYFSFDTAGLGFDQGAWLGPYNNSSYLLSLPDDTYRILLYAKIANNQWGGTVPSAYAALAPAFPGNQVIIQDNGDMTMLLGVTGAALNAVTTALLQNGYLDIKPVGVRITNYVTQNVSAPFFGLDAETSGVSGFDVGGWATLTGGR